MITIGIKLLLFNIVYLLETINCEYDGNVIDMDDILSEDLMPSALLVLENPSSGVKTFNDSVKSIQAIEKVPDGSFNNAMETMNFHRSMMNQYLCRNFIAEQIIMDMTTTRVNRRMGHTDPGVNISTSKSSKFTSALQKSLLNDEGSSSYKNWLTKSATLEDLYRHYDQSQNRIDSDIGDDEDKGEDFDEEYSGYTYSQPHEGYTSVKHRGHTGLGTYYAGGGGYPYPNAIYHGGSAGYQHGGSTGYQSSGGSGSHHGGGGGYHHGGGGDSGGGYSHDGGGGGYGHSDYSDQGGGGGGGHSAYGGGHPQHAIVETYYASGPPKYQGQHDTSYGGKDHDLADLFDIALTALAFLSFGLFIVHVIMCISAANQTTTTTAASMVMPMSMGPTATAGGGTGTDEGGGGSMTSTGGGSTGGGTTSTGTGGGTTATGGGSTGTGGGDIDMGGGDTAAGGGGTGMGGGNTGPGDGGTGEGDIDGGGGATGTGGGDIDMGGGNTGTGGGTTGTGGGTPDDGATGGASPPTGTGTGGGTTGTGTGDGVTGTGTGSDGDSGRDTFKFRFKRDIPTITNPNIRVINELARRVLTSIEAALVAYNDDGVCLRKSICENNKYSRTLDGKDRFIVPLWGLGMSWLSGRLVKNVPRYTSMLDSLKASVLGLGNANCEILYQQCDLRRERRRRRRKRRKRDTN